MIRIEGLMDDELNQRFKSGSQEGHVAVEIHKMCCQS